MNCRLCETHILATMQIMWNGYPYHADCIGEAVAQKRAEEESYALRVSGTNDYYNQPEEFYETFDSDDDEFADYENDDDLDDIIERLDEMPNVSDDVLNQIPISSANGNQQNVIVPEVMPNEMHINNIVQRVSGDYAQSKVTATLMAHKGAKYISRDLLQFLPVPPETDTFQPIPHHLLIDAIEEALGYRQIKIVRSEFAASQDGMKLFALLEVSAGMNGLRFAIGCRNANDKSMRLGMVAGYRVFVCDNMALSGEFKPMLAKHTKGFDLIESISIGVDRVQRFFQPMRQNILSMKNIVLKDNEAIEFIYNSFMDHKMPISLIKDVHREYFEPQIEEFQNSTVWSLSNAYTSAFKKLNPVSRYEQTARVGRLLSETFIPS